VLGVPVASRHLQGVDSLYSIVQMPKGVPVATFAIGNAGAANAALFAVAMLAVGNPALRAQLDAFREKQTQAAQSMTLPPVESAEVSPFSPQGGGAL
jgi:5-(carboxyamino)imidazole ribonucleotide mutase